MLLLTVDELPPHTHHSQPHASLSLSLFKVVVVVVVEHAFILLKMVIDWSVPDTPEWVRRQQIAAAGLQ